MAGTVYELINPDPGAEETECQQSRRTAAVTPH